MKYVALLLCLWSPSLWAFEFQLTPMVGLGYRLDTSNDNYSNSYQNNQQRQDEFFLTAKVYTFSIQESESKILLGGFGYVYQPPQEHDLTFSPIAYRGPSGVTMAVDVFAPNKIRGGWLGFSVGWSF